MNKGIINNVRILEEDTINLIWKVHFKYKEDGEKER